MVRTYKRKTDRLSWEEDNLIAAMHAVLEENQTINHASVVFDIPEATLHRYINKQRNHEELPTSAGRYKITFNANQEKELVCYIKDLNDRAFGLTSIEFRKLAFEFVVKNNICHKFNNEMKVAGKDWLLSFMRRHKISLRTPESTSLGRLMGFNKVEVNKFFEILRDVKSKYNFNSNRIYNADQTGVSTVPSKLPKVLSPVGTKRVAKVASGERGRNTTVMCAMNAQGYYVPPFFIFGRVQMRAELLNGTPPNSDDIAHQSGWMNIESFVLYLHHFIKYTHPSKKHPLLLIVDNHSSHCSLESINLCRENGIIMIGLPPLSTHKIQPLDVGFFGPLKSYYSQACDNFMVNNPGKAITDKDIGQLFGEAYLKAATVGIAVKSFEKCGIEPFNPGVFSDTDFAPAMTSERELTASSEIIQNVANEPVEDGFSSSDDEPLIKYRKTGEFNFTQNLTLHTEPSTSSQAPVSILKDITFQENIKLTEIRPLPKYICPKQTNRKKQKPSVITSTPNKEYLEEQENKKKEELRKKTKRNTVK